MEILIAKNYEELSDAAAKIVKEGIINKPNLVLGLATGSTPIGLYEGLIKAHKEEGLDFSKVITFNLDEYVGIDKSHPSSYNYFMMDTLFNHINIDMNNVHIPNGQAENLEEACKEYNEMLEESGGIDIQILGIGENGHIAFNEPAERLSIGTNIVALTESTISVNSRFFDSIEEVPKTAISMGMGNIMRAKKIILLVNGPKKAPIMRTLLETKHVSTDIPASLLLLHPNVTIILTEDAQ